jgi:nucleoside-diphosphate-sugar epimerase
MKVLLTGATGYIGSAVADALKHAGHEVVGLARSDAAAGRLEARGIRAHRGDLQDAESIAQAALEADAVIHAASTNGPDMPRTDRAAVEAILGALEGTDKPFIYTSGVWVNGNTGESIADEESALDPVPLVAWRPAIEQSVLDGASRHVRSIVIRPAMVYGRGGGMIGDFVNAAREKGVVQFVGTGENRWSLVHVDDLADLYVRALEKAPAGTLLLAASGPAVRVQEIAEAAGRTAGAGNRAQAWPVEEARGVIGPVADALVLDQQVSGEKARKLLGWMPTAPSLLEDLESGSYVS